MKFQGTGVAVVTPFTNEGQVDVSALKRIIEHLLDGKVEYLVMLGTTGESVTLSTDEKQTVIETTLEVVNGKVPLVCGVGSNNTMAVVDQLKKLNYDGIDGILSVSPYYNKPSQAGIINHYKQVADSSEVPVILYNVPGRTGSNMEAVTTLELAEHPNIAAVKEASGNMEQCMEIITNKQDDFMVISGDDALTLPFLSIGMNGVISVVANAYPLEMSEMVRAGLKGDFNQARKHHYKIFRMMQLLFAEGSPGGIKTVLKSMGLCESYLRDPLAPVSKELTQDLNELASQLK